MIHGGGSVQARSCGRIVEEGELDGRLGGTLEERLEGVVERRPKKTS